MTEPTGVLPIETRVYLTLLAEGRDHGLDQREADAYAVAMGETLYGRTLALTYAGEELRATALAPLTRLLARITRKRSR